MWYLLAKKLKVVFSKLQILHTITFFWCFKKYLKITFLDRTPYIVKIEFEIMEIFDPIFLLSHNSLQRKFEAILKKIESENGIFHLKY